MNTTAFLRANPAVIAILAALVICCLVVGVLAYVMSRAGVSLRPLVFFTVYLGIIGGPQVAFHLGQAFGWIPKRNLTWIPQKDRAALYGFSEQDANLEVQEGRFTNPAAVFGSDADQSLISDLRARSTGGFFDTALAAQMAIVPPSSTVIAARFADARNAVEAAKRYVVAAVGQELPPAKDGTWTFRRPIGDFMKALVAGRTFLVLTGPDEAALEKRLQNSEVVKVNASAPGTVEDPKAFTREDFWLFRPGVLAASLVLLVSIAVLWFFKGSAWASAVAAKAGTRPAPKEDLRQRLLAINNLDVPFKVEEENPNGRLIVTWRFADAKWVDLARAHGMRATHRILLELDEKTRAARATEQASALNWSADAGGGTFQWKGSLGINFFQYQTQKVFGLQIKDGKFVPQLSYSYTFNLQEMKTPFIETVTQAGWEWRPTVWQGPSWLRWLTN